MGIAIMSNEDGSHPFNVEVLDKVKTILNNNR